MTKMKKPKITVIIPLGINSDFDFINNLDQQTKDSIEIIKEIGSNTSKNRNNGIKKAKTEYVAFVNGHTILSITWLKEVLRFFKDHPEVDIVGGPQLTLNRGNYFARASGYALSSIFGSAISSNRYKLGKLNLNSNEKEITSANLICKRKVFEKVLFDEKIYPGEDPKFITDVKENGFRVAYSPSILVYNKRRGNLLAFVKQIFYYGFMRPKTNNFLNLIKKVQFVVPSAFLVYLLSLPLLVSINTLFWVPLTLYLILSLLFSFLESIKNKDALAIILLPLLFFIIHISYGLGFILSAIIKVFKN